MSDINSDGLLGESAHDVVDSVGHSEKVDEIIVVELKIWHRGGKFLLERIDKFDERNGIRS
jgi:hypothetical protein